MALPGWKSVAAYSKVGMLIINQQLGVQLGLKIVQCASRMLPILGLCILRPVPDAMRCHAGASGDTCFPVLIGQALHVWQISIGWPPRLEVWWLDCIVA